MLTNAVMPEEQQYSSYLQYLPAIYSEDDFSGRFLRIFEEIIKPVQSMINDIYFYFDLNTTPESFLPWLASWLGLVLDERWTDDQRRQLIKSAVELYRWSGTIHGLSEYLRIYTGVEPKITEFGTDQGMRLGGASKLGAQTQIGGQGNIFCFTVELNLSDKQELDTDIIKSIIEIQKPAHTAYILKITSKKTKTS
jgi:phage tail-like protein